MIQTLEFDKTASIEWYFDEMKSTFDRLDREPIREAIDVLHQARMDGRQIFIMGNGGSASTASHAACDLAKNTSGSGWPLFKVFGLADNTALFSALSNDYGYENVFVRQLEPLLAAGDVVIAISTSGNSPNVLRAAKLARERGALVVGLTGFDGGQLGDLSDLNLHIPSDCIEQVEDVHLMLEHLIVKNLREMPLAR